MADIRFSGLSGQQRTYNSGTTANRPVSPVSGELYYDTTLGGLMIYNGVAWSTFLTPASVQTPTSPTALNSGSGRSYNNGAATVSFTGSSELGGVATLYTVTSSPGSIVATGTSSPIVVTGLQSNTAYTFTVKASNSYSNATSSSTSSITATTTPDAPVLGTAIDTAVGGQVSIPITSVNDGGSAITNYQWSTDGTTYTALSPAQTSTPIIVSGLTNNQATTLRLKAVNANGAGTASSATNSVTPTVSYYLAQTFNTSGNYTVPNGVDRMAVYVMGGGGGGGNSRASGGAYGGQGGYGAGVVIVNPSSGTTYGVTVGAAGAGTGIGWGAVRGAPTDSSFGSLINSNGSGNASGIVSGNAQGAAAGAPGGGPGGPGGAGGNIVLSGVGLPAGMQYGGGGGGGGGGGSDRSGGAGGSPYGGAGGGGQGGNGLSYNPYNGDVTCCWAGSGAVGNGPGGGGGSGGQALYGDEYRGYGANGAAGRVVVYLRSSS